MAPKNPPIPEGQIVSLRRRKRDRLPHQSARPVRLVRCRISRSARFRPACHISDDYAGHILGRSLIRRGHLLVSTSSKTLSLHLTSPGRHLLREKIRRQRSNTEHRISNRALCIRRWVFDIRRSKVAPKGISIMIMSTSMSTIRSSYDPRVRRV